MKQQKSKWKKLLAMLLCAASVLGQVTPVAAMETVSVVTEEVVTAEETTEENVVVEEEVSVADEISAQAEVEEDIAEQDVVAMEQDPTTNIALGKTVVASSQEAESVRAANAVDGNTTNHATSRWGSAVGAGPHWIYVDLGETMNVKTVGIYWENRKATAYKIQIATTLSNPMAENDWTTVKAFTERPAEITEAVVFDEVQTARYVRLLVDSFTSEDPDGGETWQTVSIYELEVYGGEVQLVEQDPTVNVARGKTAVADSTETNTYTADKALDGDTSTDTSRWSSAYGLSPHWIYVDLGRVMDVKSIRLYWETRKATSYKIQLAQTLSATMQESDWTDAKVMSTRPAALKDTITLDSVQRARYVRLYISEFTHEDPDGGDAYSTISIYEMEVYGGDAPVNLMETITYVQPKAGDKKLELVLPEAEGKTITYNGTDYEQLVDDELNIYQPIVDSVATVSVKITDNDDPTDYQFKEMAVTIPGQYAVEEGDNAAPNVLPELREWKGRTGVYKISETTRVVYKEDIFKDAAEALAKDYKSLFGNTLTVVQAEEAAEGDIFFKQTTGKGLFKEGYLMDIGSSIVVEAEEATGAYWATRTILQSMKADGNLPKGITRDYPLYEVRGFILDVGRKTFTLDYLKQVVQEMAWYKMNDFQIHLNDNYIFLEQYTDAGDDPMTAYSGFRLESDIKKGGNGGLNKADLTNTDVFYTKAEFRDLIKEARACGVNIVPEIDVPAHSLAFTKVRPDLRHGTSGRNNDHLALATKFDECVDFVQSVFDEYMGTNVTDPVFDEETIVHIGCDEYSANPAAFRNFSNVMIDYVQDRDRTVRMWGSLSSIQADVVVKSEDVQMNLWNFGWANMDQMYEEGFDLINCNDGQYYIVPNAGYYGDYLGDGTMYNQAINSIGGVTIPAGDDQMLGGAFAVWNDMVDLHDNGVSEYDVYDRIKKPMALFGAKLWGKHNLSLNNAIARSQELGSAPGNDFGYEVEDKDGVIAHYPMDNLESLTATNAEITQIDGKNALQLKGNESYVKTDFTTVGLGNDLRVKVKRTFASNKEQILFESSYGSIKAVQSGTGNVGFTRENYDYSFNYTLPVNEWVELEFKNAQNTIQLYVNGKLVDAIGDGELVKDNRPLLATMMFPVEKIGSETKAFIGYVDDVRLGTNATYNTTMALDYALVTANQVLETGENEELTDLMEEAKVVVNTFAPSAEVIAELVTNIETEIAKTGQETADYSAVNAYLAAVPEDLSIYTAESVSVLNTVVASVRTGLPKSMQETVDGYERALAKALAGLVVIVESDINYVAKKDMQAVTASSYQSGEGPEKAVDGNNATHWHCDWDNNVGPHWIQIELKEATSLSGLVYVPRTKDGKNGIYTGYDVQISDNGTDFTSAATGTWNDDTTEKTVTFTTPVTAKYIRLVATSSVGNFGSAAEVKLKLANVTADMTGLNTLIDKVNAMEQGNYTDESWNALMTKFTEAETLAGQENINPNDVEVMKRELSAQIAALRLNGTPEEVPEITGPFALEVSATGDTTATLSFAAAKGADNIVYDVVVTQKDTSEEVNKVEGSRETTHQLTGLVENAVYVVKVTASDGAGNEGYAMTKQFTHRYRYVVTFIAGEGVEEVEPQSVEVGGKATEPTPLVKNGYAFKGWVNNRNKLYNFNAQVTEDITLTAKWVKLHTVTFNDAEGNQLDSKTIEEGNTVTEPAEPTKEGHKFLGWFAPDETVSYNFATPVTKDLVLTQRWVPIYTVSFNSAEGSKVDAQTIERGQKATKPADPTREGYIFQGWFIKATEEGAGDTAYNFETATVTADITLTAKWTVDTTFLNALILAHENDEKGVYTDESWAAFETALANAKTVRDTATTAEQVRDALNALESAVDGREEIRFSVTFVSGEGATIVEPQSVVSGQKAALPTEPIKEGHKFLGWYTVSADNVKTEYDFDTPVETNLTLVAVWMDFGGILEEDQGVIEGVNKLEERIWVVGIEDKHYNGTKQTQDFRVYDGNKKLEEGVDYTVSYKNNQNVYECVGGFDKWDAYVAAVEGDTTTGLASNNVKKFKSKAPQVILKMKGDYTGSKTVYFKIAPVDIEKALEEEMIALDNLMVSTANKKQAPTITVLWDVTEKALKQGKDYKVVVKEKGSETVVSKVNLKNAADYDLTLEGIGNFTGEITGQTFSVVSSTALSSLKVKLNKVTWDGIQAEMAKKEGEDKSLTDTEFANLVLKEIKNGSTEIVLGEEDCGIKVVEGSVTNKGVVGNGTLMLEAADESFSGTRTISYTIAGTAISKVDVRGINKKGYSYTGTEIELLELTNKKGEKLVSVYPDKKATETLVQGTHFDVKYDKHTEKGNATLTLTGKPEAGYTGTKKVTYKINAYDLSKENAVTVELVNANGEVNAEKTVEYASGGATPKVKVMMGEKELKEGIDYTLSYKNNKAPEKADAKKAPTVTVKGKGSFTKSTDLKFTIDKKAITADSKVEIVVNDKEYKKGKTNWKQSFKVMDENGIAISNKEYTAKYTVTETDGVYELSASGKAKEVPENSVVTLTVAFKADSKYYSPQEGVEFSTTFRILEKGKDISKATVKINGGKPIAYTGDPIKVEDYIVVTMGKGKSAETLTLGTEYKIVKCENNVNKGTAKVTIEGLEVTDKDGNVIETYGGEKTVTFKIGQRDISNNDNWWKVFQKKVESLWNF